jgi:hypothetical protein
LRGYLACLQESSREVSEIETVWISVISNNSSSILLLADYLEWKISRNYQIDEISPLTTCLEDASKFTRRLQTLQKSKDSDGCEDGLLFAFTKSCTLLAQSGYIERCIAAFQAQIEFNCFYPPAFANYSFEERVNAFEDFWDGESARFGETGYVCWRESILLDLPASDIVEAAVESASSEDESKS